MADINNSPNPVPAAPETDILAQPSTFDGTTLQLIGWRLLGILLSIVTLGIGAPWAQCMIYRWQARHTLVEGQRLQFDGKGHQLLGKYLLWGLLILVTLGIYTIFLPVRVRKWHTSHLSLASESAPPPAAADSSAIALIIAGITAVLLIIVIAVVLLLKPRQVVPGAAAIPTRPFPGHNTEATDGLPGATQSTAPQSTLWYVNIPAGLRLRTAPNTDSEVLEILSHGTPVYVEYWEEPWAFIGSGWCHGKYLTRENPLAGGDPDNGGSQSGNQGGNNSGSQSGNMNAFLTGSWRYARYDADTQRLHLGNYYTFNADGTFSGSYTDSAYYYDPAQGWVWDHTLGAGGQSFAGTFEYDGSTLVLTYSYLEWEDTVPAPETRTASVQSGVLYMNSLAYYPGSLESIANLLCPNPPVPDSPTPPLDPAIVGTWNDLRYDSDCGKLLGNGQYTFAADGTFSGYYGDSSYIYSTSEGWIYDVSSASGSERFGGTYQYDGATLKLTFDFMEWSSIPAPRTYYAYIDGGVLYMDSRPLYQGSVNDIGNRLCPDPFSGQATILDASIFGTWYGFRFNGDRLEQWKTYTFNSDGTCQFSDQDTYYLYSAETGLSCVASGSDTAYGFYTYNGSSLRFGNDRRAATVSGNTLCIDGAYFYRGNPDEIALQLFTQN